MFLFYVNFYFYFFMLFYTCTLYTILSPKVLYCGQPYTYRTIVNYYSVKTLKVKYHLVVLKTQMANFHTKRSIYYFTIPYDMKFLQALSYYYLYTSCKFVKAQTCYIILYRNDCIENPIPFMVMKKYYKEITFFNHIR